MRRALQIGLVLALAAVQLPAAEMANLRNGFGIRHERHETMGAVTRLYLTSEASGSFLDVATDQIKGFEPAPPEPAIESDTAAGRDLWSIISDASARSHIDADFIASVIRAESAGNAKAVSPKGAQGLMQLMPQTASTLGVRNSFDPEENVDGGVRYLRDLLVKYNGNAAKALAAYNAGPQRVQQYGGVPPYRETHAYVARVINDYNRKKTAQARQAVKPESKTHTVSSQADSSVHTCGGK